MCRYRAYLWFTVSNGHACRVSLWPRRRESECDAFSAVEPGRYACRSRGGQYPRQAGDRNAGTAQRPARPGDPGGRLANQRAARTNDQVQFPRHGAHAARDKTSPTRGTTVKLDEPWSTDNGEAVWQFKDGDLTFVRSHQTGAVRTIVSLKLDGQKLTCATSTVFAREQGKNGLVLTSPIDGAPVTILSWKQVSSTCEVTLKSRIPPMPSKPAAAEGTPSAKRSP